MNIFNFAKNNCVLCAVLAVGAVLFTSCESSISIKANKDSSTQIQVNADVGPIVYNTIKAVTAGMSEMAASGNQASGTAKNDAGKDVPIFSAAEIKSGLSTGDMTDVSVSTPTVSSLSINGKLSAPADQVSTLNDTNSVKVANFVTCTKNSLTLILAPAMIKQIGESLPQSTKSYLDLLMAPVFTGEQMSASEYIDVVAAVYGDELSKELASSAVKITLAVPDGTTIKKTSLSDAQNVKTSAGQVTFSIPLAEFLTLSATKTFSISW